MRWALWSLLAANAFGGDILQSAKAVLAQDPALALAYCRQEAGPEAWPVMLEADVRLGNWGAAERVGEAAIGEIDAGRLFPRLADIQEEAGTRRWYAEALDQAGKTDRAREQRCISGQLLEAKSEPSCAAGGAPEKVALERDRRIARLKTELLAGAVNRPAPPLDALKSNRGSVVVTAFWASWCAPCLKELEQLGRYHHPGAVLAAVDIDRLDSDTKRAYLPLQSLEAPEVPQLYVIDAEGNIRFHLIGFEDDGLLGPRLDWMIEAISR